MADRVRSWIPILEASYQIAGDDAAWLSSVVKALAPQLDAPLGIQALLYDASNPKNFRVGVMQFHGCSDEVRTLMERATAALSEDIVRDSLLSRVAATSSETLGPERLAAFQAQLGPRAVPDTIAVNAVDPTGRGCLVQGLLPGLRSLTLRQRIGWERVAAHLAAGHRLRYLLRRLRRPVLDEAEAIVDARGRVAHAAGEAQAKDAQEALRSASRRIDRARIRGLEADQALAMWRALVEGRWSIVDHFDSDGRRYFVALKNDPALRAERRLSPRERQVAAYAALGHSNKLIAYELGLGISTVASHLASAEAKLGVKSRVELIAVMRALFVAPSTPS